MKREPQLRLLNLLSDFGTKTHPHSNRSLYDHFVGVYTLLGSWSVPEHVGIAGLFHSLYGSHSYTSNPASLDNRTVVSERIGADAEELVYLYCVADRVKLFHQLLDPRNLTVVDRHLQRSIAISQTYFSHLIELLLADCIEQMPHRTMPEDDDETRLHLTRGGLNIWCTAEPFLSTAAWRAFCEYERSLWRVSA